MKKKEKKSVKKDPNRIAAAKKAWKTKRANAKAVKKETAPEPITAPKKAGRPKKEVPKRPKKEVAPAAPKKAGRPKKEVAPAAPKKAGRPKKEVAPAAPKKAGRPKKEVAPAAPKKAGRPKKEVSYSGLAAGAKKGRPKKAAVEKAGRSKKSINAVVSFFKISEISGISLKKLRNTAKRKKLQVTVANDSMHGISQDKIPTLVAEIKANELSSVKLEKIQKDEIWFESLRQELDLTVKQLEIRCKRNGIGTVNRYPKLSFKSHFRRALKKEDADKLRSLYAPVDETQIKKLVSLGLS